MWKTISLATVAASLTLGTGALFSISNHPAAAQAGRYLVNVVNLDIKADQFDKFMDVAKEDGAAAVKEPGCREFNITVAQNDPHHVMFFQVYDSAAALDAHRQTEHYKKYQAVTKDMVAGRDIRQFWSVAMNLPEK
jgi:(4S)-4-hydroxy-5-phosphonooxypentane-2,3-dione isomerase